MAITNDSTDQITTLTAVVSVRVPDGADGDLATAAQQRLGRIESVRTVTVEGFRGLEPQLSATIITVESTVESAVSVSELRDEFAAAVCVAEVKELAEIVP